MKRIFATLLLFATMQKTYATDYGWYYIYIQTEYEQGPWTRTAMFKEDKNVYLEAKPFTDLFGSDSNEMATIMFNHLKKEDPERYTFKASLNVVADTVVITTTGFINDFEAVKNELVATFTLNSFAAVRIRQKNEDKIYKLKDVSVPYMDLIMPNGH